MKNLKLYLSLLLIISTNFIQAQEDDERMYHLNLKVDIPLTVVALGATYYGFENINGKDDIPHERLNSLDKSEINAFDRSAAGNYDDAAEKLSDPFFLGAFPFGLVLLTDEKVRDEMGTIGLMYLEAVAISSGIYAMTTGYSDRLRPLTYNTDLSMDERDYHGNRNSFIGGHPMITATTTFFVAKIYSDLHPESSFKYVAWGFAGATTATCAYLRYKAGKHFPSDLLTGVAVGTLSGILVPEFHKKKRGEGGFSMIPLMGRYNGLSMNYTF